MAFAAKFYNDGDYSSESLLKSEQEVTLKQMNKTKKNCKQINW